MAPGTGTFDGFRSFLGHDELLIVGFEDTLTHSYSSVRRHSTGIVNVLAENHLEDVDLQGVADKDSFFAGKVYLDCHAVTGTAQENVFSDEESCLDDFANDNETPIVDLKVFIEAGDITENNNDFY